MPAGFIRRHEETVRVVYLGVNAANDAGVYLHGVLTLRVNKVPMQNQATLTLLERHHEQTRTMRLSVFQNPSVSSKHFGPSVCQKENLFKQGKQPAENWNYTGGRVTAAIQLISKKKNKEYFTQNVSRYLTSAAFI